ncbi:MAG: transposase [Candidatus Hadarchaeota archaeon]|nr:transposase [Candidatus Hadarchaeota archaeon]
MELTQKIRIKPSEEQEEVLTSLSEMCRLLYNFSLAERRENWEENKDKSEDERGYITYTEQQNKLPELKKKCPRYRWVYSKVLQMTLRKLDADFKSFYGLKRNGDEKARPPRFKGKKYFTTLAYNQSGFKIEPGLIKFSHNHPSGVPLEFEIPEKIDFEDKDVKQVEISRDELKKEYYVSITYEVEAPEYVDNGLYQAFDLGIIKHTGVNMRGKFVEFWNPRPDKYWKPKIREVQSKRDRCKKGSCRWRRYNQKLRKMRRKLANQLRDRQHKTARKIVDNTRANTIIIGKTSVKEMVSKENGNARGLNHSLQNTGMIGRFARFLTYKAELVGKKVIEIGEEDTTKECCVCGKKENRPLYERRIKCDCGNAMDRDRNSAVNILKRFLSRERPADGLFILAGMGIPRQTAKRKTRVPHPATRVGWEDSREAPCES